MYNIFKKYIYVSLMYINILCFSNILFDIGLSGSTTKINKDNIFEAQEKKEQLKLC